MKTSNFVSGLTILQKYYDKDGYNGGCEHDQFYMCATNKPLEKSDLEKMIELGWHQEYDDRDYSKDFSVEDYRADDGWIAYF